MPDVDEPEGLTLADYLRILRRNWLLITIATVLGTVGAGVFSVLSTPQYQASTQLYVSVQASGDDASISNLTQGGTYARQAVLSYVDVIESASVLDEVIEDLDLGMTTNELRGMVSASSPTNSVLIDVDVTGPDPEQAAAIANAVGASFSDLVTDVLEKPRGGGLSPVQISTTEEAAVPEVPVSPNTTRNLALGLALGLMTGVGLAVLRTALDTRVTSVRDIHQLTDVPVLGGIVHDPKTPKHPLITHTNPRSVAAEEFRALRTNLQFVNVDGAARTFVVTSSVPNEGKTTVATNLAISLAQSGASVALVDADMRKPSVARVMGVDGEVGLSSLLVGMVELEDVLHRWGKGGEFFVLPAGRIPPNPSELLGSEEMERVLALLNEHFDYVILDTPPVLAVTDAAVLSRITGGTIVVTGVGLARKNEVAAALETIGGIANRLSGIVVNRVPGKGPDAYHYGRYEYAPAKHSPSEKRVAENPLAWLEGEELSKLPRRHTR